MQDEAGEGHEGKSVFRCRSSNGVVVDDRERDRLALIYRNGFKLADDSVACQGERRGARYWMVGI